ncbi:MAG: HlyD family secretion protein [Geminicoccaceae bacterium]
MYLHPPDDRSVCDDSCATLPVEYEPAGGDAETSPPAEQPLFRPEALAERQTEGLGTVLLVPKLSHGLLALGAVAVAAAIIGLLFVADYTRKERVQGVLLPETGMIRVFAPKVSVVTELHVKDGGQVEKGAPLLTLSTDLNSASLGPAQAEVVRRLREQLRGAQLGRGLQHEKHRQAEETLSGRLSALEAEEAFREREIAVQRERVELADDAIARLETLHEQGLVAAQDWRRLKSERLDDLLRLRTLERDRAAAERERLTFEAERNAQPIEHVDRLSAIDRDIAALEQALAEAEASRAIVLPAPRAGVVTTLQAEPGARADPSLPLLSIVPSGAALEAKLYVPSRARGFLKEGQRVLLRYQAFPHQKFGQQEGRIATIARATIAPDEHARRLAGVAEAAVAGEAVYPITVRLEKQTVTAYGEAIPLQPGMALEADVQVESRRLIEWVFDPLFTLTGRLSEQEEAPTEKEEAPAKRNEAPANREEAGE